VLEQRRFASPQTDLCIVDIAQYCTAGRSAVAQVGSAGANGRLEFKFLALELPVCCWLTWLPVPPSCSLIISIPESAGSRRVGRAQHPPPSLERKPAGSRPLSGSDWPYRRLFLHPGSFRRLLQNVQAYRNLRSYANHRYPPCEGFPAASLNAAFGPIVTAHYLIGERFTSQYQHLSLNRSAKPFFNSRHTSASKPTYPRRLPLQHSSWHAARPNQPSGSCNWVLSMYSHARTSCPSCCPQVISISRFPNSPRSRFPYQRTNSRDSLIACSNPFRALPGF